MDKITCFYPDHLEPLGYYAGKDEGAARARIEFLSTNALMFGLTLLRDDVPIAVVTFVAQKDIQVCEVCLVVGEECRKNYRGLVRSIRRNIEVVGHQYAIKKMFAQVDDTNERDKRFIEHFGFTKEATLRRHGPGGIDVNFYSRWF